MVKMLVRLPLIIAISIAAAVTSKATRFPGVPWVYTPPPPLPVGTTLTLDEFRAEIAAAERGDPVLIIDARKPEEFAAGHIGAANLLNVPSEDAASHLTRLEPFSGYRLALYCTSVTCDAAETTFRVLSAAGYDQMKIYPGGWDAWRAAGLPTVTGPETMFGRPIADGVLTGSPGSEDESAAAEAGESAESGDNDAQGGGGGG